MTSTTRADTLKSDMMCPSRHKQSEVGITSMPWRVFKRQGPTYVIFAYVFPTLASIISASDSLSPISRLRYIAESNGLGAYDPYPPVLNLACGVAWVAYAVARHDPFLLVAWSAAVVASTYVLMVTHAYADEKTKKRLLFVVVGFSILHCTISALVTALDAVGMKQASIMAIGGTADLLELVVYVSPLRDFLGVMRCRDASCVHLAWSALQFVDNILWMGYSACVDDVCVLICSLIGVVTAALAIVLKLVYPSPLSPNATSDTATTAPVVRMASRLRLLMSRRDGSSSSSASSSRDSEAMAGCREESPMGTDEQNIHGSCGPALKATTSAQGPTAGPLEPGRGTKIRSQRKEVEASPRLTSISLVSPYTPASHRTKPLDKAE